MDMTLTATAFNTAIAKHPVLIVACNRFDKGNTTGDFRYKHGTQYFYYIGRPGIQTKYPTPGPTWAEDIAKMEKSWQRTMEEAEKSEQPAKRQRLNNSMDSGHSGTDENAPDAGKNSLEVSKASADSTIGADADQKVSEDK